MQSTKWEIVQQIKRLGGASVEELAQALSVAPMTIRQHLASLQMDSLITYREVHGLVGRPRHQYTLTLEGEELFPRGYHRLAGRLIEELQLLQAGEAAHFTGEELLGLVFRKTAERMAATYAERMRGKDLEQRVAETAQILSQEEGTLSEWHPVPEGYVIEDFNCPFHRVAQLSPYPCAWHLHLLSSMVGAEVNMETCQAQGASCCRYLVREAPSSLEEGAAPAGQRTQPGWQEALRSGSERPIKERQP